MLVQRTPFDRISFRDLAARTEPTLYCTSYGYIKQVKQAAYSMFAVEMFPDLRRAINLLNMAQDLSRDARADAGATSNRQG